jgi:hypothetical protein
MNAPRQVLLVGSLPIRPVGDVFTVVAEELGPLVKRIPDGEAKLFLKDIWDSHARNPGLQRCGMTKLNDYSAFGVSLYEPKNGVAAESLTLGPYGYAKHAKSSHAEFVRLREAGKIPRGTRYQLTMPGPGTTAYVIQMEAAKLLPLAAAALCREIEEVLAEIPGEDLAMHLDIAMEAEHEEYVRAPGRFNTPVHEIFHWSLDQMADAVATVANRIPERVELGLHICSIWHHDPAGGQDNKVLVETANTLAARIKRSITYIHIPVVPEHDRVVHYLPFSDLRLDPATKLFLGLLNLSDGLDGAQSRISLAQQVVADFGIAFYCGLGMPSAKSDPRVLERGLIALTPELDRQIRRSGIPLLSRAPRGADDPALGRASEATLRAALALHRRAADL